MRQVTRCHMTPIGLQPLLFVDQTKYTIENIHLPPIPRHLLRVSDAVVNTHLTRFLETQKD